MSFSIQEPSFYKRNVYNDLSSLRDHKYSHLSPIVTLAVPLITFYAPKSAFYITAGFCAARFMNGVTTKDKNNSIKALDAMVGAVALVSAFSRPALGLMITNAYDFLCYAPLSLRRIPTYIKNENYTALYLTTTTIFNDVLYLATFFTRRPEIVALSFGAQILSNVSYAGQHLRNGNHLNSMSQLALAAIRGTQYRQLRTL